MEKHIEDEEKYSFTWIGKNKAMEESFTPTFLEFKPCKEESIDWDTTDNLFLEGDNLDVLKLLQEEYTNKIKMIYIDPPYNTGNNLVYKDKYKGSSDYRHSSWLNMMYPRLKLANNLLTDDGVIFISIDDREVANLRKLCEEIFGEKNFLAELIWKKRTGINNSKNNISVDLEYIVTYSKSKTVKFNGTIKDLSAYKNPDNDPRGPWKEDNLKCVDTLAGHPSRFYTIEDPKTGIKYECNPNRVWSFTKDRMDRMVSEGKIIFPTKIGGVPTYKRHLAELNSNRKPFSSLVNAAMNAVATKEIISIMGGKYFDFAKSTNLIKQLIGQATAEDDIVLDFFAGSCTTAHAVLDLNKEDGGNRKFIMVQLPELTNEKSEAFRVGYKNIADIGKERIRRVIGKIKESDQEYKGDLGFKVFKLEAN